MKIGLKSRFSDLSEVLSLSPDFVEFQFSDKDVDYDFSPKNEYLLPCIIHLPEFWDGYLIDISSISNENQVLPLSKSREVLQQIITKSERFFKYFKNKKNIYVLHPGGMSFERDYPVNNKYRMEALIESLSLLKTDNAEILVENLPPFPWYFGGQWNSNIFMDAQEISEFCKITGKKICYDTSHSKLFCNYQKKDFFSQLEIFKKYMMHIHIADGIGVDGEGIQIDEGEINFHTFFNSIREYDNTIVNEVWNGYINNFSGFKIAVERIKKHIDTTRQSKKKSQIA